MQGKDSSRELPPEGIGLVGRAGVPPLQGRGNDGCFVRLCHWLSKIEVVPRICYYPPSVIQRAVFVFRSLPGKPVMIDYF